MKSTSFTNTLWGEQAKARYLYLVAAILFFTCLGSRELWTQEHRWADIVYGMFFRHDFLHPYLGTARYYDKPLLSYWLVVAASKWLGGLSAFTLRLPSALAGLLGLWSVVRLGTLIKNRSVGLLAGWMFITTYYIVFWARVSSADMLNLGGSFFAIAWYLSHRDRPRFTDYLVFFLTLALTSLCKGLGGAIVPLIAVLVDVVLRGEWRKHCQGSLVLAALPALVVYLLPFWASSHFGGEQYGQSGLYLVYRENILRYFQPFDHEGPFYTYFVFLPIYLLPWTVFFIPALLTLPSRLRQAALPERWLNWTFLAVFLFFTLSGSRRSYYVLPIVPFAILFTAVWLAQCGAAVKRVTTSLILTLSVVLWLGVAILPAWYGLHYGMPRFANMVQAEATAVQPWKQWQVLLLDADTKVNFYLSLPPTLSNPGVAGDRGQQTSATLLAQFPVLKHLPKDTIVITRETYLMALLPYFPGYRVVMLPASPLARWMDTTKDANPIAFIPLSIHD